MKTTDILVHLCDIHEFARDNGYNYRLYTSKKKEDCWTKTTEDLSELIEDGGAFGGSVLWVVKAVKNIIADHAAGYIDLNKAWSRCGKYMFVLYNIPGLPPELPVEKQ